MTSLLLILMLLLLLMMLLLLALRGYTVEQSDRSLIKIVNAIARRGDTTRGGRW